MFGIRKSGFVAVRISTVVFRNGTGAGSTWEGKNRRTEVDGLRHKNTSLWVKASAMSRKETKKLPSFLF